MGKETAGYCCSFATDSNPNIGVCAQREGVWVYSCDDSSIFFVDFFGGGFWVGVVLGNGICDEYHVIRHVMNLEAVNTYEGNNRDSVFSHVLQVNYKFVTSVEVKRSRTEPAPHPPPHPPHTPLHTRTHSLS